MPFVIQGFWIVSPFSRNFLLKWVINKWFITFPFFVVCGALRLLLWQISKARGEYLPIPNKKTSYMLCKLMKSLVVFCEILDILNLDYLSRWIASLSSTQTFFKTYFFLSCKRYFFIFTYFYRDCNRGCLVSSNVFRRYLLNTT